MDLEAAKRASTFQLLLRCARRVDELARARVNAEAGRVVVRASTVALLPHVSFEGTRITELAAALGISKQAASKRVAELEAEGVLVVEVDPTDARARRVRFTPFGLEAIGHGLGVLAEIERELAAAVGAEPLERLGDTLRAIDDALDPLTTRLSVSAPGG
ncbi:MAG: helix-turn-helix domain-containing protein [Myxococcota bacterium]